MNQKPQSRKDKIQLLKDLHQRKISLDDLIPETTVIWHCVNGIYELFREKNSLKLTEAEFKEYTSQRPKQKNIIFKLQEGCEPIPEEE